MKKVALNLLVLAAWLTMAFLGGARVGAQGLSTVLVAPNTQTIGVGGTAAVEVWVNSVSDFYAVEFELAFAPSVVRGIQITPGAAFVPYPNEHEILENAIVDDKAFFAATLLRVAKAPPLSGDLHLATITFEGLAAGTSPLTWVEIKLANSYGKTISYESVDGSLIVEEQGGGGNSTLTGRAFLEGRSAHGNIVANMSNGDSYVTTTATNGWYTFTEVVPNVYNVSFIHPLYLTTVLEGCVVNANETAWLPDVTLLGGDLNDDEVIDISDLVIGAANFNTNDPMSDVNGDGLVDIYDIVLIGKNFGLTGPIIQVCVVTPAP